ncbi:PhnD/SsuA/transferrin family substrate-binding protein [Undibacterium crateris]|uniref:PhnD/SsuA/transferrin family substrate-binding protein n=1 Tax=Undibacterium crateris TaxID=2528175 RepID=UPI0013898237|nr:PhnD/SsuA/transferrin family substrate-binding protein [Undibacterium crateris]NDI84858.1 PhnD/SsuA/transferrin family substrate-binding protein [Undibacterium crateris]
MKLNLIKSLSASLLALCASVPLLVNAAPALRMVVQEGTSSSGESEYSTRKYQQLASVLSTYLKREVQVTGLSPSRQFDADPLRQADILIARPNAVAGMAIQTLGYTTVVGLDSGVKSQTVLMGPPGLKKFIKSPEELKKLRFAMPPADSEITREALRMLAGMGVNPDALTVYNVNLQATIPFALENKMADVGVVKSDATVFAKMTAAGHVVLADGEKTAPWVMLANKKMGDEQVDQLRMAVMSMMNNAEHKAVLQNIRVQNVVDVDPKLYVNAYRRYSLR